MYESPRLVPINTINAAYGNGSMSMGLCSVNVNANTNANANVNAVANVNVAANVSAAVNAAAAANAVAVVLVVCHYTPLGSEDPRTGGGEAGEGDTPAGGKPEAHG